MKMHASPVKLAAEELGIACLTPEKARDEEFIKRIAQEQPTLLVVASYGQILPERLLQTAKNGAVNLHGSILPKYRGAAPIQRAILNGDRETGVTLMQMDKGMDTGDIIDIRPTPIKPDETYGELQQRLSEIAAQQLQEWLPRLLKAEFEPRTQRSEEATIAAKIDRTEGELKFERGGEDEYNRYRAFTPRPGAYILTKYGRIGLAKARLLPNSGAAGTVLSKNAVAFKSKSIELLEVKPDGKKRMSGADFFNGMRLRIGDSLLANGSGT